MNADGARRRLRDAVVASYTNHTMTRGGVVKAKTATQRQLDFVTAKALVAFAVDYDLLPEYRTPDHLWDVLVEKAKESGELVIPLDPSRPSGFRPLQHRLDYQLEHVS